MIETKLSYRIVFSGYVSWNAAKDDLDKNKLKLNGFCYIEGYNPDGVPT